VDTINRNVPEWYKEKSDFRYDGERYDIIRNSWFDLDSKDDPTPSGKAQNHRQLWDGEKIVDGWFFRENNMKDLIRRDIIMSYDEQLFGDNVPYVDGAPLLGIFKGDIQPVTTILKETASVRLRETMESVNGSLCYVIESSGKDGEHTVWVDPEHGYNIAKAKVRKSGNNMAFGEPMGPKNPPVIDPATGWQRPEITGFSFELYNVKFEEVDGRWVPIEADYDTTTQYDNNRIAKETRHHRRTLVDLEPDFEAIGAFSAAELPDGTHVMMPEAQGVRYKWLNGKIVPDVDNFIYDVVDFVIEEEGSGQKTEFAMTQQTDKQIQLPAELSTAVTQTDTPSEHDEKNSRKILNLVYRYTNPRMVFLGLFALGSAGLLTAHLLKSKRA
jgi:hypothetical protein